MIGYEASEIDLYFLKLLINPVEAMANMSKPIKCKLIGDTYCYYIDEDNYSVSLELSYGHILSFDIEDSDTKLHVEYSQFGQVNVDLPAYNVGE